MHTCLGVVGHLRLHVLRRRSPNGDELFARRLLQIYLRPNRLHGVLLSALPSHKHVGPVLFNWVDDPFFQVLHVHNSLHCGALHRYMLSLAG